MEGLVGHGEIGWSWRDWLVMERLVGLLVFAARLLLLVCCVPFVAGFLYLFPSLQAINGAALNAMGQKWHPEHFMCSTCSKPLPGQFITVNLNPDGSDSTASKPYCESCGAPKPKLKMANIQKKPAADPSGAPPSTDCAACGKVLSGKVVKALGSTFHKECLTCFACPEPPKCSRKGQLACAVHGKMPLDELPPEARAKLS
jgi:hypothetical protein